jgi:hypothetical protein
MKFMTLIQAMYDKAFSSVQIKGYVAGPFPIQCLHEIRLSNEFATIRFGFETADIYVGATSHGQQDCTTDN